jgi:FixJ family two-component response regulator
MNPDQYFVFIIDDDPSMRRSLESLLRSVGLTPRSFESAHDFLLTEVYRQEYLAPPP